MKNRIIQAPPKRGTLSQATVKRAVKAVMEARDMVNHPYHYTSSDAKCSKCAHPMECIDITRNMGFNQGNAVKYLWRYLDKNGVEDLKKAKWYIDDLIKQMESKK